MTRHVLLLDLIDDPAAIARYRAWHAAGAVPDAVARSIRAGGVDGMEIYLCGNRLVMVMETGAGFDPDAKAASDRADPDVAAWERLMDGVQRPLPWAVEGAKWTAATRIFDLGEQG